MIAAGRAAGRVAVKATGAACRAMGVEEGVIKPCRHLNLYPFAFGPFGNACWCCADCGKVKVNFG